VKDGRIEGIGELKLPNGFGYAGTFKNGKRQGSGRFYIQGGDYQVEGMFDNDEP